MLSVLCLRSSRLVSRSSGGSSLAFAPSSRSAKSTYTLTGLYSHLLQKEIEVLLHEIFIPILEMKTSTLKQKAVILSMLQRLCQEPQALVEIYLNYDCDGEAVDNIYEQYVHVLCAYNPALIIYMQLDEHHLEDWDRADIIRAAEGQ